MDTYQGRNVKDLRMIRCRLTRIFNPECNLSICSCVYVADQFNMDKSKLNLGANVGDIPRDMTRLDV